MPPKPNALLGDWYQPPPEYAANPLYAGTPTWADAATWHGQNLADTAAAVQNPQTWQDAASQYGNALLMGSIAPSAKWYHGTSSKFGKFTTPEVYLTDNPGQAQQYAQGAHRPGQRGGEPSVMTIHPKPGETMNVDDHLFDAMDAGDDVGDALEAIIAEQRAAKSKVRYLEYTHPNAGDQGEHTVRISLYPHEDLVLGK